MVTLNEAAHRVFQGQALLKTCVIVLLAFILAMSGVPVHAADGWTLRQSVAMADEGDSGGDSGGDTGDSGGGDQGGGQGETGGDQGGGSGSSGGDQGGGSGSGGGDQGGGSGGGQTSYAIRDLGIHLENSTVMLGYATNPNLETQHIDTKGGSITFQCDAYWTDGSTDPAGSKIEWSVSDQSVATINSTGVLTAVSDGTVEVRAKLKDGQPATSSGLTAKVTVEIKGQSDAKYIKELYIIDRNGDRLSQDEAYVISVKEGDISSFVTMFYVEAVVKDPSTGEETSYKTTQGSLQSQVGISDVSWKVDPEELAAVDEPTGQFRPKQYGTVFLTATSSAGMSTDLVTCKVGVKTEDPDGGVCEDDYHPQTTFKVKAYYELYPPSDLRDDSDMNFVTIKEYSAGDLEYLGATNVVYTAVGSGSYYTNTGYGVYVSTILGDAGVDLSGIKSFHFGTVDNVTTTISYGQLFANRYYFPYIDEGSGGGAVQVAPMIAIDSSSDRNGRSDQPPSADDLLEATRFRLLLGAQSVGDSNSQYQIKWINTLYVVLEGGPPVEDPDQGGGGGTPGGGGNSGGAGTTDAGDGSGSGSDGAGSGSGLAKGPVGVNGSAPSDSANNSNSAEGASGDSAEGNASEASDATGGAEGEGTGREFNVLQVMNNNDTVTQSTIDYVNPFRPWAFPAATLVFVGGGLRSFIWYRRQLRAVPLSA